MAPPEGQREHSEDEKFGLLDWGKLGGVGGWGSAALFSPWVTRVSQVWAAVASLIIWQQYETVQP